MSGVWDSTIFRPDGAYVSEQMLKAAESSGFGYSLDSDEFYTDNYLYEDTSYYESIRSFYLTDSGAETAEGEYKLPVCGCEL